MRAPFEHAQRGQQQHDRQRRGGSAQPRRRRAGRRPESRAWRASYHWRSGIGDRGSEASMRESVRRGLRQHRGPASRRPAAAAPIRIRLHRRRRRSAKSRSARTCAPSRTSPSGRARAVETPAPDLATTVLGHADRAAVHPGAGRQQPDVLAARRRGRGRAPRARPGTIYSLSTLSGCRAGRREEVDDRARRGISSICAAGATSRAARSSARRTPATPR